VQGHVPPNATIPSSILVTRAPPNNPKVEYRRYKAMYILISLVKNNLLLEIFEFEDLRKAWMHLQKIYEIHNLMKKMHLKNHLQALKITKDTKLERDL
jgi:hypothetical protein